MTCDELDLLADELATGTLTGRQRADALAHVATCAHCATEVADLSIAADMLLLTAPSTEPPLGFESRVLGRIGGTSWPNRRAIASRIVAVAAAVVLITGVALVARRTAPHPAVRRAAMRADNGKAVGYALAAPGHPDMLLVQIDGLKDNGAYTVVAVLRSGRTAPAGTMTLTGGAGVLSATAPAPISELASVRLVSADGERECRGTF